MSRTAIGEIIDLNLNPRICDEYRNQIQTFLNNRFLLGLKDCNPKVLKREKKKMQLRLYYALELIREDIWEELIKP